MNNKLLQYFCAAAITMLIGTSSASAANWTLSNQDSKISYGSIKKNTVGEVNHFTSLSGSVDDNGLVSIEIDLSSVETWIDIRNERMRDLVFKAINAETATLTAQVDIATLNALAIGDSTVADVDGELNIGGASIELSTAFYIARLSETRVLAITDEMIMVSTEELGLNSGVDKLREVAKLPSITRVAPVTLRLVFDQNHAQDATAPASTQTAAVVGDAAKGKRIFRKCQSCHVADKEKNRSGPHLVGLFGRAAGSIADFKYSKSMADSGVTWTPETLAAFLAAPKSYIKGNKMSFRGLKKAEEIDDIIAYLKIATNK